MKKTSETVVFFGSGPVAAESLERLLKDFEVEAVITKPSTVKEMAAMAKADCVYQVNSKSDLIDLMNAESFNSRVGLVIDFGMIIPKTVIDCFPLGIVNSHFSVLPQWRGADPITFAILSGQQQTGVSLMLLVEKLDEGPLLAFGEYDIPSDVTTPQMTADLIDLSHSLLKTTLPDYMNRRIQSVPQTITGRKASYSRKLTKQDGLIDWHKPAAQIEREIRAFLDWPKSQTSLAGHTIIVTKAAVVDINGKPGDLVVEDKQLIVYCARQALKIQRLKPVGKPEMSSEAFLAGYRLS